MEVNADMDHGLTNVLKTGILTRPKKLVGWKDRHAVYTQSGFLHLFDKEYEWETMDIRTLKYESMHLMHCCLAGSEKHPEQFELVEEINAGFFRRSVHVFKVYLNTKC